MPEGKAVAAWGVVSQVVVGVKVLVLLVVAWGAVALGLEAEAQVGADTQG